MCATLRTVLSVFAILTLCSAYAFAQGADQKMTPEMQAEMQAWMAYMTPGEAHKHMAESVGSWKTATSHWHKPGTEAVKSTGTCEMKMIMGGRYLQATYSGTVMGMPFEGMGVTGFDNKLKKYISSWVDNMSTGMTTSEGSYDPAKNALNMTGTMVDPTGGEGMMEYRMVIQFVSKDKQVMQMFMQHEGQEFKAMEIVYTRA